MYRMNAALFVGFWRVKRRSRQFGKPTARRFHIGRRHNARKKNCVHLISRIGVHLSPAAIRSLSINRHSGVSMSCRANRWQPAQDMPTPRRPQCETAIPQRGMAPSEDIVQA